MRALWLSLISVCACAESPTSPATPDSAPLFADQPCGARRAAPASVAAQQRAIADAQCDAPVAGELDGYAPPWLPVGFTRDDEVPPWVFVDPSPRRTRAYHGDIDQPTCSAAVFVAVNEHPAIEESSLDAWSDAVLRRHDVHGREDSPEALRDHIAVYAITWRDERERPNLEYAVVQKGCERLESYRRFIQVGAVLFEVTLEIDGTAPPPVAAVWLQAFFDAPFGGRSPSERRFAFGHETNL